MQKYYLYIDECGDHNLAYDTIKNNIYSENTKQIGIKLIPHQEKKDCQNWQSFQPGTPQSIFQIGMFAAKVLQKM